MADTGMIDAHHHVLPQLYRDRLATIGVIGSGGIPWPDWSEQRMADVMGRNGITHAVTTITSPGHYFGDAAFARTLTRDCNEWAAGMMQRHKGKAIHLASLPLPDTAGALHELEYAMDTLKMPGVGLLSHNGDRYLGEPEDNELYAELDKRKAIAFVHPVRFAPKDMPRFSYANGTTELVFDTTRAIVNLLYTGTFAKYPNIRWIFSHCGGVVPFIAYRLRSLDKNPKLADRFPGGVEAVLRRQYYDTAQSAGPASLGGTLEVADPDKLLFGTDFPLARAGDESVIPQAVEGIEEFEGFDAGLKQKIYRKNAEKLFPSFAK